MRFLAAPWSLLKTKTFKNGVFESHDSVKSISSRVVLQRSFSEFIWQIIDPLID